jgi:hypothetical protein
MRPGALLVAALVLPAVVTGCIASSSHLAAAVSAPLEAGGLTIFLVAQGLPDGSASCQLEHGGVVVYPPGGIGCSVLVQNGQGTLFLPYSTFVVGNGAYNVTVQFQGVTQLASADVEKWVNYVFLHPSIDGNNVRVDAQLSRGEGGEPTERILAAGMLGFTIMYHGVTGTSAPTRDGADILTETSSDETATTTEIPQSDFNLGPGWYSIEAFFNNAQALNNLNVGNDPSMADRTPPWNWVCIQTCS